MKKTLFAVVACAGAVAAADPSVTSVRVSQPRPWSSVACVSFTVAGTGNSSWKVRFTAFDDEHELGELPEAAMSGDAYVDSDGVKNAYFNPADVDFLRRRGAITGFRIGVDCEAAGKILYKVVDLRYPKGTPWQTVYVTEADLHSGSKQVGVPGSGSLVNWDMASATNHIAGVESLVWTGVTNNTRYLISHLVLRRVAGGSFRLGTGALARDVAVRDYWIGVFPMTKAQVACLETADPVADDAWKTAGMTPCVAKTYGEIRGLESVWPEGGDGCDAGSLVDRLRSRAGVPSFDLPTEAQWEWACRAGTSTTYYNNTDDASRLGELAWYNANAGNALQTPGKKMANGLGLYDMIGNVWEYVRDWYSSSLADMDTGLEPAGPVSSGRTSRLVRGGAYKSGSGNCTSFSRTGDTNTVPSPATPGVIYGFRVVQSGW